MADLSDDQLRQLCDALGWQGGTFWQVLEQVRRLASTRPSCGWDSAANACVAAECHCQSRAPSYPYPSVLAQALLVEHWLVEDGHVPAAIVREFSRVLREAQASPPGGVDLGEGRKP